MVDATATVKQLSQFWSLNCKSFFAGEGKSWILDAEAPWYTEKFYSPTQQQKQFSRNLPRASLAQEWISSSRGIRLPVWTTIFWLSDKPARLFSEVAPSIAVSAFSQTLYHAMPLSAVAQSSSPPYAEIIWTDSPGTGDSLICPLLNHFSVHLFEPHICRPFLYKTQQFTVNKKI